MNDHLEPNAAGIYGIRICKNGEFIDVVIDDYIPVMNGEPAFSRSNGHELWVILLEKAWAKIYGSYLKLEGGLAHHALRDLTGALSYFIRVEGDKEELWRIIMDANEKYYIMTISAQPEDLYKIIKL